MYSTILRAVVILLAVGFIAACSNNDSDSHSNVNLYTNETGGTEEVTEDAVRITISINNGQQFVNETEFPHEENKDLLHLLKLNFFVEEEDGVITSIERVQVNEEKQTEWVFFLNDEKSETEPGEYIVQPGDKIQLDLQPSES